MSGSIAHNDGKLATQTAILRFSARLTLEVRITTAARVQDGHVGFANTSKLSRGCDFVIVHRNIGFSA